MPRRRPAWIWVGRVLFAVIVAALVTYLVTVGVDKADKLASTIGAVVVLLALGAPYLLPSLAPALAEPGATHAAGSDAVAVDSDSTAEVSTDVRGVTSAAAMPPVGPGVTASGTGSVAIGGSSGAPIRTKVTEGRDGGDLS
jgi:hypothetical protein